ncbi:unnamed protein product [Ixodes pacificus]
MARDYNEPTYYDSELFNRCITKTNITNKLKLFHLNARSLRNKSDEVCFFLDSLCTPFDVLAFTETWYSGESDILQFQDYKSEVICHESRRGGGVALYIKNKLNYHVLHDFTCINSDFESLVVGCGGCIIAVVSALRCFKCFFFQFS